MEKYLGTKLVLAQPMTRQEYNDYRGWALPENEEGSDEGMLVEYVDGGPGNDPRHVGYISWSPLEVFNNSYRVNDGLTFGEALNAIKVGKKVTRKAWIGTGMFVYYVPPAEYPVQTGAAASHFGEGSMVPYAGYMALKNHYDRVSVWHPSTGDYLGEDWSIVE